MCLLTSQDAVSLPQRPALHNSSIILFLTLAFLGISEIFNDSSKHEATGGNNSSIMTSLRHALPWMFCVALSSHHVRDAARRGLWFSPFGSTSPLPYAVYVLLTLLLPNVVRWLRLQYDHISDDGELEAADASSSDDEIV